MIRNFSLKLLLIYAVSFMLFVLFAYAFILYNESKVMYLLFTIVYFYLLISALYKPKSYSYMYLGVFLFLGMWLKLTLHLIFRYAYVEPIGSFYTLNSQMDDVLKVAIIGATGVISSNIIYRLLKLKSSIYIYENYIFKKPLFYLYYSKYKEVIYFTILTTTILLVYFNFIYEIQLSGLVPKTILIYPFNAIIYWVIGTGFAILLLALFTLDINFTNTLNLKYLYFFAFIVSLTSIGLLSRGQYVFIVGSLIVFLLFNYKYLNNLNIKKLIIYIIFAAILYFVVIYFVTILRSYYFSGTPIFESSMSSMSSMPSKILSLAVDRWIGLEGLMAVSSYEHKSYDLFLNSLTLSAEIGKIDIYQYISNAHYKDMDNTKYAFATIPGAIAFLYYTGSFIFVFTGMFFLSFMMLILEYYLYLWYKSALIASLIGIYLSNFIAQFGLTPINLIKSMFFTFSFLLLFKLLKLKKI